MGVRAYGRIGVCFVLVLATLLFAVDGALQAVDLSVTARVTVEQVFTLSVDRDDINFYDMKPGETRTDIPAAGIRVTTKSNTGHAWFLKLRETEPLTNGKSVIPDENFGWYGWTEGSGTWMGTGKEHMLMTPQVAYVSTSAEGLNADPGVANVFKFKLDVPKNQEAGNYQTTVQFILTE